MDSPIAILTLAENVVYQHVPFHSGELSSRDSAVAYGFPKALPAGYSLDVQVNNVDLASSLQDIDANTTLDPSGRIFSFEGMSGSALIVDGDVAGILLRESAAESLAYILYALTGNKFRQALRDNGFEPVVAEDASSLKQSSSKVLAGVTTENRRLHSELNLRCSQDLKHFANLRISGKRTDAWAQLKKALESIRASSVSQDTKASYYYMAAIWSLEDDTGDADIYLQEACSIDSSLDTRMFCSAQSAKEGHLDEAIDLLGEIDSIEILNERVKLLYHSNKQAEAIAEYQAYPHFIKNVFSWELLALCNMELSNYPDAHVFADKFLEQFPTAPSALFLKGQIYWGQALFSRLPKIANGLFLLVNPTHFLPDTEQYEYLSQSYDYYVKAVDYAEESQLRDREWYIANLVSVSTILPGKDTALWLAKLENTFPLSPLVIFYRIVMGKSIPDAQADNFLTHCAAVPVSAELRHAQYLLLIERKRFDEAKLLFASYSEEISKTSFTQKEILEFDLSLKIKDWSKARALTKQIEDKLQQKRILLAIDIEEGSGKKNKIIKTMLALAEESGAPLDYCNMYTYCRKHNDWRNCITAARGWYQVEPSLAILMHEAEALLYYHRESKAYALVKKIEKNGYYGKALLRLKAKCLYGLSRRDEVMDLLDRFQFEGDDAELLLLQAYSYIEHAEKDAAIRCLKNYVDRGYKDKAVMDMLVALLKTENLTEAFAYAKRQHDAFPEDKDILMGAYHLGLMTGDDTLGKELYALVSGTKGGMPNMKYCSAEEVLSLLEDSQRTAGDYLQKYIDMQSPLSTTIDLIHNWSMGKALYEQWENGVLGVTFAVSGTGASSTVPTDGSRIILDYTACVTAIKLNILDDVCKHWNCYISPLLMPIIMQEIAQLKTI